MRTTRGGLVLAEERPRSPARRVLTRAVIALFVLGVVVAGWFGVQGALRNLGGPQCQATALENSVTFDPVQTANAATITALALERGLPPRAATIAIATAIQESKLRNLRYGDRDSVGLFQQRPSQGWGTAEQILDPVYATTKFYDALVKIEGYEAMEITEVAQEVQRSAYPEAYADHEQEGRILASALTGNSPEGLGCRLDAAEAPGDPAGHAEQLRTEMGVTGRADGRTVTVAAASPAQAWAVGAWSVAKAEQNGIARVQVGSRAWTRTRDGDGWEWQSADGGQATAVTVTFAG